MVGALNVSMCCPREHLKEFERVLNRGEYGLHLARMKVKHLQKKINRASDDRQWGPR